MEASHYPADEDTRLKEPPADELLTAEEVAALLQVTAAWVYAETRRKRIPHLRLGRYVRYRRSALRQWMDDTEKASARPPLSRVR